MDRALSLFESIVRRAASVTEARSEPLGGLHPFDERNIHPRIEKVSKKLFDDGHYSQATFEAYKLIDREVQRLSKLSESGVKLMMRAFNEQSPLIPLTTLSNTSEKDEQEGYKFIFSGSIMAIRNPRGHEFGLSESPTQCLDHLSLASLLLRRLEEAKV
jgi:uncharacterized protein (TIGR02391 family)